MKKQHLFLLFICVNMWANAQNTAIFTVKTDKPVADVQPTMWGIFFEDINLGADGGIYAELIKNRSFEFLKPLMGWTIKTTKSDTGQYYWQKTVAGEKEFQILTRRGNHVNNPRYVHVALNNHKKGDLGIKKAIWAYKMKVLEAWALKKGCVTIFLFSITQRLRMLKHILNWSMKRT